METARLASIIDSTLLRADATPDEVRALCAEARRLAFAAVCVNPWLVPVAASELPGPGPVVAAVVGFPLGAARPDVKALEAERASADGAAELDMVINLGALGAGDHALVSADIAAVRRAAPGARLKVILETCLLSDAQIDLACRIAVDAGADCVKTSTGFSTGGATVGTVRRMRAAVGPAIGVKASGGVRTRAFAEELVAAGADRLGTSCGAALLAENAP